MHSLASLFPIKEGSTFLTKPLFPQGREDVTALWCLEPLHYKDDGPKRSRQLCGMGPSRDEKRGRLLLAEILDGGNFGRHFTKYAGFTHQSMGKKYFLKIWRNMHFVRYFPAEALCEPLFRSWHFFWRLKYKKYLNQILN